jgi:hypothetical protein
MIPREKRARVRDMKNLIIFCVIFLLLALNCFAAPLQLGGGTGRSILGSLDSNNSTNQTNSSNGADLWGWGKLPLGYSMNATGKLIANPVYDNGLVTVSPQSLR